MTTTHTTSAIIGLSGPQNINRKELYFISTS